MPPLPLSNAIGKIAARALDRKVVGLGALLGQWAAIVGPELAEASLPVKLNPSRAEGEGATLCLAVSPARALEFQHEEPRLIARINGFFGYRAVAAIKLTQRQMRRPPPPKPRQASSLTEADIAASTGAIADPDLRAALASLGRAMKGG